MKPRRVGPLRLVELIGDWSSGNGPLYLQLADAIRHAIDNGDLRPGSSLPAERTVASTLAVSRTTVVAALNDLKRRGYLDSAPGSGTWVRTVRGFNPGGGIVTPPDTVGRNPLFSRLGGTTDGVVDMTASVLGPSALVAETIGEAGKAVSSVLVGHGYHPVGLPRLRETVAEWFTRRGVPTTRDEVLITAGGQQAIMLAAASHIQPGDPVVVESPTYPGALDAFRLVGAAIRTVPVSEPGVGCEAVIGAIEASQPRITYLIPTFHNPTGTVMSEFDRVRLGRQLTTRNVLVIEDESLVELSLTDQTPPLPLAAHLDTVLTVGSASKPFWGGLRVGWIRGPEETIRRLVHYKTVFDLATPATTQAAAALLLERSEEIIAERKVQLAAQASALSRALDEMIPDWTWTDPSGGLSVWASIPRGSTTEFSQLALRHGVAVVPGPFFDPHGLHDMQLRLPFVLPVPAIEKGVGRLAEAWNQYRGGASIGLLSANW